ncbi:MAG: VWA domain-containing protein [Chloroflexota bacterium]
MNPQDLLRSGLAILLLSVAWMPQPAIAQSTCGPLDVAILIDTTGSMLGAIDNVKAEANNLVDKIVAASGGDYQLALVTFQDSIVVLTDLQPGTADGIKAQIGGLQASAGNSVAEASDEALNTVINRLSTSAGRPQSGNFSGIWRAGDVTKIIILITDAPPGGFDDLYEWGVDDLSAAIRTQEANANDLLITAVYVPTAEGLVVGANLPSAPSAINIVNDENAAIAEQLMRNYATGTGGGFVKTAQDGQGTARAIEISITECGRTFDVNTDPGGDGDLNEPVSVPEPITVVLFGAGLAGVAGVVRRRRKEQ